MTEQVLRLESLDTGLELWAGPFGEAYTKRNQVNWQERIMFWYDMLDKTGARSVFELGCNAGWNLSAILDTCPRTRVVGSDINPYACEQARHAGLEVYNYLDFTTHVPGRYELVFTSGVLIHIETEYLEEVMRALIDKSYRWVLAVEYDAPDERQIEYRGHRDKCWARPYGALYEKLGLRLHSTGDAQGFDQCRYWLMERV